MFLFQYLHHLVLELIYRIVHISFFFSLFVRVHIYLLGSVDVRSVWTTIKFSLLLLPSLPSCL